jgi:hypothetical protein
MEQEHALIHEELARLDEMASGGDSHGIVASITRLVHDSREHFEAHIEDHANMMENLTHISAMELSYRQLGGAIAFARNWIDEHIRHHDAELLRYLP